MRWTKFLKTSISPTHLVAIALGVLVTLSFGTVLPTQAATVTPDTAPAPTLAQTRGSFVTAAVNRVGPAVVRIDTERVITRNVDPFFDDPFFRQFFGDQFFQSMPREQLQRGQGSGFIIDGDGTILTNAHVVNQADRVTVKLKDGRDFEGRVMGVDVVTDLAVVKIDAGNTSLPVATLGDSDRVQVGDWAIAVGNPLGLDNTVTLGIVSTLNRSSAQVGIPDKRLDFIQTDAAINPGNSGGPLLDEQGRVIGVNTAIRADANGIGFAIPINTVKAVKDQLARGENVAHPFVGIQMITLTPEIARENNRDPNAPFRVPEQQGVLVMRVVPNSPAAAAGLRRGDVITAIDGQAIETADELQRLVENSQVGQVLRFQVLRDNRTLQLRVRTGELQPTRS
ncbi:HhoA/HhoB/HtrA family serine endopeptidase [Baaleninema simplex]|uniref:HhoA/HhoB/HtrA family serine endopeptidase n=1 Tax=Baaleninema simplex TaxID=2862350 RepID=UPI0003482CA6|nr:HhoA/HhoB/HtrA family serine endopeptidase [Baaleninema simplex]